MKAMYPWIADLSWSLTYSRQKKYLTIFYEQNFFQQRFPTPSSWLGEGGCSLGSITIITYFILRTWHTSVCLRNLIPLFFSNHYDLEFYTTILSAVYLGLTSTETPRKTKLIWDFWFKLCLAAWGLSGAWLTDFANTDDPRNNILPKILTLK